MTSQRVNKTANTNHRKSLLWLLAWLFIGTSIWYATHRTAKHEANSSTSILSTVSEMKPSGELRLASNGNRLKSIERIQVGERVATDVSQEIRDRAIGDPAAVPKWDRLDQDVDSDTWRRLILAMYTPEGDRFDITLLRPSDWIESCNAQVGSPIHLVVSEQGLDGLADVLAIEPCPTISSGVGRVVSGTFTHVRGGILRIKLTGLEEPIGVTSNHSIYSVDRSDFVHAGELRVGESLRQLDGDVQIESIEKLSTEERVYNLEIQGEHVFHVAASGVLVHNSSGGTPTAIKDLKPIQGSAHTAPRQYLRNLTDDELLKSARKPLNGDGLTRSTRDGILRDGNGRAIELQRRALDPNSKISPEDLVPVKDYTPDLSMFPDLD